MRHVTRRSDGEQRAAARAGKDRRVHRSPRRLARERLAEIRQAIQDALPGVTETWKDGIIAIGNAHKAKVKLTFPQGSRLADPGRLFNAGLGGNAWRAIDLHEQGRIDVTAFRTLVQEAAALNGAKGR